MKNYLLIPVFALLCFASSCSESVAKENPTEKSDLIKRVEVIRPLKKKMPIRINVGTTLKADEESKITAEVSAPLIRWYVEENDRIKKRDPIAKLDSVNYEIQKNQADANLKSLESQYATVLKDYERLQRLVEKEAVPKQQLDALEGQVEAFRNQIIVVKESVELANRMVEKTTVRAPFSGVVTVKKVSVGEFVAAGAREMVTLVKTDILKAQINVSEMFFSKINEKSEITFHIPSINRNIKGKIKSISKNIDNMKQFNIIVNVNNEKNEIPAGIYAVAEIVSIDEDRILLPSSAIKEIGGNKGEIYTVDSEGIVRKIEITTAIVFEEGVEIGGNIPEFVIKDISDTVAGEKVKYVLK
jgi:membrane fusion protein (multidrug efflux system)